MGYSVSVDGAACVGSGQCALFSPSVFEVRDGLSHVTGVPLTADRHESVLDAADACPVQAIEVTGTPD